MSESINPDIGDKERLALTTPDKPMRCDMCVNEVDLGIRYTTKLGRIALCTDCLDVIKNVAENYVETGENE